MVAADNIEQVTELIGFVNRSLRAVKRHVSWLVEMTSALQCRVVASRRSRHAGHPLGSDLSRFPGAGQARPGKARLGQAKRG